ncbi:hypothetical protein C0991_001740, partial [Blastosporella zonata]
MAAPNATAAAQTLPLPPPMNRRPPQAPQKLRIWQQNVRKSFTTQADLINSIRPEAWDIVALQEPYLNSYGNTMANNA